jgi:hypothetical protein
MNAQLPGASTAGIKGSLASDTIQRHPIIGSMNPQSNDPNYEMETRVGEAEYGQGDADLIVVCGYVFLYSSIGPRP